MCLAQAWLQTSVGSEQAKRWYLEPVITSDGRSSTSPDLGDKLQVWCTPLRPQHMLVFSSTPKSLESRCQAAFESASARLPAPVLFIGMDCPTLDWAEVEVAIATAARGCAYVSPGTSRRHGCVSLG